MDVFEAVNTRRHRVRLIVRAQRAASGGNLQSWNVYALANKPLADFKRIVAERIARDDPRHAKSEYPIYPEPIASGACGVMRVAIYKPRRRKQTRERVARARTKKEAPYTNALAYKLLYQASPRCL